MLMEKNQETQCGQEFLNVITVCGVSIERDMDSMISSILCQMCQSQ